MCFFAAESKCESQILQSLQASALYRDDEKLRDVVDHWMTSAKKLELLVEELVSYNRCNCHVFILTWSLSHAVCYLSLSLDPADGPVSPANHTLTGLDSSFVELSVYTTQLGWSFSVQVQNS